MMLKRGARYRRLLASAVVVVVSQAAFRSVLADDSGGSPSFESADEGAPRPEEVYRLKPVTVTAEKVSSTEQKTPVSMTVMTGEDLERSGAKETLDMVRQAPNLHMIKAGQHSDASFFSMRGVTPAMEGEQPVGFFIDGVHHATIDTELLDVDRIEVLRGPQSTLYGRNTEAGAITIVTRDPEPYREGSASVGFATYDRKAASAIVGGPMLDDGWSFRTAVRILDSEGYFTRQPDGRDDVDETTDINARLKVRWNPRDAWDVIASYDGQRYRDGATGIAFLDELRITPHTVSSDYVGFADTDVHTGSLRVVHEASAFTITSISALTSEDKTSGYDIDFTAADTARLDTHVDYTRFTQELRLSSPDGTEGPRWVGGAYYFDQADNNNVDIDIRGAYVQSIRTRTDTRNMAAFGQMTWPLLDQVALTTGLRYDHETKRVTNSNHYTAFFAPYGSTADMTFDAWLPKVALEYWPLPGLMGYASYAHGYKAGGFNNLGTQGQETFDAEYTTNYEAGVKFTGLDDRLKANLSAFWIDWTDQQVEQNVLTQSNISNAGKSVSRGLEAELAWQATNALVLKAAGGWNDAHFVKYLDGANDYSGKRPPNAPAYTYSLGADLALDGGLYAHADWLGTGNFYFDSANTQEEEHYGLLNLRAGYQGDGYEVALWLHNALDTVYATRAFDAGGGRYAGFAGEPRTVGVTLTAWW